MRTFREFRKLAESATSETMRTAELYWKLLTLERPDIAAGLEHTQADPYYADHRLPKFWDEVARLWVPLNDLEKLHEAQVEIADLREQLTKAQAEIKWLMAPPDPYHDMGR